jgi:uncharacterized protein YndB with AHSA1/START domain/DNA-binding transcriptional ArsR family regulator
MPVNDVFGALANPVRRRILELLRERPRAAGDIASEFDVNRPAISEHLQVLRNAGLVSEVARGRQRFYHLNAIALSEVQDWLLPFERYWQERLQALSETLSKEEMMVEPGTIQLTQYIAHPPAKVWAALTEPKLIAKWWAAGDVRPVVGHHFTLDMGQWGQQPCEVLAVEPERLLAYSFAPGTLNTTITWRLQPEGTGTRLSFEQSGFDLESPIGKAAFEGMGSGWPGILTRIESAINEAP